MTPEILVEHIDQAIAKALRHESWIDESILSVGGFSSGVIRRFFSNLVHLPKADPAYLECGLFKGGTICAAMNNSPTLNVYGAEDYSQPFGQENVREELERNLDAYRSGARSVTIFDADCFKLDLKLIRHPIDVFFYDAVHSYEAQRDALPKFLPAMSDVFCLVVDDFSWVPVREGSRDGLKSLADRITIHKEWVLGDGTQNQKVWHNDLGVYCISRKL